MRSYPPSPRAALVILVSVGTFCAGIAGPRAASGATPGGPVLPDQGALWGSYVAMGPTTGSNKEAAIESIEALVDRPFALDRVYYNWDEVFPDAYDYASRSHGRTLALSWSSATGPGKFTKWSDIAAGGYDDVIDVRAADIKAFSAPMFFTFSHEPENDQAGTPAEFVSAWKHIHDRFVADGVTNVSYALVLMAYTYRQGNADQWYPGTKYVDLVGADGYNWYGCPGRPDPWHTFSFVFEDFHNYGVAKGKPEMIAEWGSMEDPQIPGRKAGWIIDAAATLRTWPEVKAVAYYNNGPPSGGTCKWWVDTSATSLAAYTAMGADPYFDPPTLPWPDDGVDAYVGVYDDWFSNTVGNLVQGANVQWEFLGPSDHTATDRSGMGLFDSGEKAPGSSYSYTFNGAGNYSYECTLHANMTQTVKVPLVVSPLSGGLSTTFTVTWAAAAPPPGRVENIQIKRPGQTSWTSWLTDQTGKSSTFLPDGGRGTYSFRAQLFSSDRGVGSSYSAAVSITVN